MSKQKIDKTYSHEEVFAIIQNLPKIQQSLQVAVQTVLSVLEDVAMVIRAIPQDMIREAVEQEMENKFRAEQYTLRPRAIEMDMKVEPGAVEELQKILDSGKQIPADVLLKDWKE